MVDRWKKQKLFLRSRKKHDAIKKQWASDNGFMLIEISDIKDISNKLVDIVNGNLVR